MLPLSGGSTVDNRVTAARPTFFSWTPEQACIMSGIFTGTLCRFQLDKKKKKSPKRIHSFLICGEFTADCQVASTQNVAKLLPVGATATVAANGATLHRAVKEQDLLRTTSDELEWAPREGTVGNEHKQKDASNEWALTSCNNNRWTNTHLARGDRVRSCGRVTQPNDN